MHTGQNPPYRTSRTKVSNVSHLLRCITAIFLFHGYHLIANETRKTTPQNSAQ
ncbi:hypothetical protein SCLCIDRAFT_1221570 [Scleroderma citrinum Foug A]|uniref:Uncharacterized protein n=1 Tax=Scleroderma citrinum Foug A TaxID=1036808 RepID=A0A0C3D2A7_9AGAM|nr:hypothetical protein SCLCIDRAFT_1221570 [Scleroderma citrinum Foug A]